MNTINESKNRSYRKLTGWKLRLMGSSKLLISDTHLLAVDSLIFSETYKRLYFKDIQGIFLRKTKKQLFRIAFFSTPLLVSIVLTQIIKEDFIILLMLVGIPCLILIAREVIKGRGCEFIIKTAVQTLNIPSVDREKKALQVLSEVNPKIENAQGKFDKKLMADALFEDINPKMSFKSKNISQLKNEKGLIHLLLFGILILQGAGFVTMIFYPHPLLNALLFLSLFSVSALSIAGMVKQFGTHLAPYLKVSTIIIFFIAAIKTNIYYFTFIFQMVRRFAEKHINSSPNNLSPMVFSINDLGQFFARFSPQQEKGYVYLFMIFGILSLTLGITGLIGILNHRKRGGETPVNGNEKRA